MKYLLRVLFILALFCGAASHARADSFHVQVLDAPDCASASGPSLCIIASTTAPFGVDSLNLASCNSLAPGLGLDGCVEIFNDTFDRITSLTLTFPTANGLPNSGFTCSVIAFFSTCTPSVDSSNDDIFTFTGGAGLASGGSLVLGETGANPDLFDGMGVVGVTPEPDSLLLLSTGAMMMAAGLYLRKQRRFAFGKR